MNDLNLGRLDGCILWDNKLQFRLGILTLKQAVLTVVRGSGVQLVGSRGVAAVKRPIWIVIFVVPHTDDNFSDAYAQADVVGSEGSYRLMRSNFAMDCMVRSWVPVTACQVHNFGTTRA